MSQCLSGDNEMGQKQICLVGFQGAGKTTVGKWLSSIMKIDFFDLDASLLAKHGYSTIQEAFISLGEEQFRREELLCMESILDRPSYIVACGGGALQALEAVPDVACVVYLFRSFSVLRHEIMGLPCPLWLKNEDPLLSLHQRWEERHPVFFQRANVVVMVEKKSVEDDGQKILSQLRD